MNWLRKRISGFIMIETIFLVGVSILFIYCIRCATANAVQQINQTTQQYNISFVEDKVSKGPTEVQRTTNMTGSYNGDYYYVQYMGKNYTLQYNEFSEWKVIKVT